jgi:hypothetical protein
MMETVVSASVKASESKKLAEEADKAAELADAAISAEQARVFPSRATVSNVFKKDIRVLKTIGRFQDCLVLFNCVYCAMFAVNFCNAILTRGAAGKVTPANIVMCVFALMPAVLNMAIAAPMVVLRYSFVSFVIKLRPAILGEVIEDQAESSNLRKLVHERLMESLENIWKMSAALAKTDEQDADSKRARRASVDMAHGGTSHGKMLIRQIFDDIDEDNSGNLDRAEFQKALEQLGVYLRCAGARQLLLGRPLLVLAADTWSYSTCSIVL